MVSEGLVEPTLILDGRMLWNARPFRFIGALERDPIFAWSGLKHTIGIEL